eukprot:5980160-Prymnesium_polylepis.1
MPQDVMRMPLATRPDGFLLACQTDGEGYPVGLGLCHRRAVIDHAKRCDARRLSYCRATPPSRRTAAHVPPAFRKWSRGQGMCSAVRLHSLPPVLWRVALRMARSGFENFGRLRYAPRPTRQRYTPHPPNYTVPGVRLCAKRVFPTLGALHATHAAQPLLCAAMTHSHRRCVRSYRSQNATCPKYDFVQTFIAK